MDIPVTAGASTAGNSAMPALLAKKRAQDMSPGDWKGLLRGLIKFLFEESEEPEHSGAKDAQGDQGKHAAGIVFVSPEGRVLLLKRSDKEENYAGHWALPGGKAEKGESPEEAADREATEEIGVHPPGGKTLLDERRTPNGFTFRTFLKRVGSEFEPKLNDEHSAYKWAGLTDLPQPMHPSVKDNLGKLRDHLQTMSGDCASDEAPLACDEFGSVRTTDKDGHLHIARTPITRAVVSDYYGREINGWQRFGLDPERKYGLYRDLEELRKGADSFIGKPVLLRHKPSTADDHPRDITVGAIGGPLEFDGDTLFAPLTIWDAEAIRGIETGERRGLSCGYRYEADMTPGNAPDGTRYDGRMLKIEGNHLAIIPEPRVQGAMVADSITGFNEDRKEIGHAGSNSSIGDNQETQNMTTAAPARLVNALSAFIKPRLAPNQTLEGIEAILALDEEAKDKRARDEEEGRKEREENEAEDKRARDRKAKDEAEETERKEAEDKKARDAKHASDRKARDEKRMADRKARDSDPDGLHEWLKKKLGAEDFKAACDMLEAERKAEDEDDEDEEESGMEDRRAHDSRHAFDEAAIDRKIQAARSEERRIQAAIYEAKTFVRPYVGELSAMAFDSAEEVYGAALKGLNISTEGVHPSAYRKILEVTPKPGQRTQATTSMAMDSSARSAAEAIAPGLKRIKIGV